jgi:hypothetical protein
MEMHANRAGFLRHVDPVAFIALLVSLALTEETGSAYAPRPRVSLCVEKARNLS